MRTISDKFVEKIERYFMFNNILILTFMR